MNRDKVDVHAVFDELTLIRSMAALATEAVMRAEDHEGTARLTDARLVLQHVEQRMFKLEETYLTPQLKVVGS